MCFVSFYSLQEDYITAENFGDTAGVHVHTTTTQMFLTSPPITNDVQSDEPYKFLDRYFSTIYKSNILYKGVL